MEKNKTYTNNLLTIEVTESNDTIRAAWRGKSIEREPAEFITPILIGIIKSSSHEDKKVELDFRELTYMNSSTITPIIKVLDRAKRGSTRITVRYDKTLKWQDLNFSALFIFKTKDNRIEIEG